MKNYIKKFSEYKSDINKYFDQDVSKAYFAGISMIKGEKSNNEIGFFLHFLVGSDDNKFSSVAFPFLFESFHEHNEFKSHSKSYNIYQLSTDPTIIHFVSISPFYKEKYVNENCYVIYCNVANSIDHTTIYKLHFSKNSFAYVMSIFEKFRKRTYTFSELLFGDSDIDIKQWYPYNTHKITENTYSYSIDCPIFALKQNKSIFDREYCLTVPLSLFNDKEYFIVSIIIFSNLSKKQILTNKFTTNIQKYTDNLAETCENVYYEPEVIHVDFSITADKPLTKVFIVNCCTAKEIIDYFEFSSEFFDKILDYISVYIS